ncbi:hypothetical protein [uncultured Pseudomonas sp.]|uniref:hypothetical protein n=1 Tax=uncultured Pseudomonas sp. TaxID=114707 RepID=UPI0027DAED34|nr:hypothetical protein [uncultured Pseudomonas sp.]
MFISRSGKSLDAVYGIDSQGKPDAVAQSSPHGVALTDVQRQMITNSKFFEAGASMALLNQPGRIGEVFDQHAAQLATVLRQGLSEQSVAGGLAVHYKGREQPLRDVLQATIEPLAAQSDQIGRQMKPGQALQPWLINTLQTPLAGCTEGFDKQNHVDLLTKIRASSAFGSTMCQLMAPVEDESQPGLYAQHKQANTAACVALLREAGLDAQADQFADRFKEFSSKTRTPAFDNPLSRARSERMPMVEVGGELRPVKGVYEDAAKLKMGFGLVVQNTVDPHSTEQAALRKALGDRNQNLNAIPRQGAPIADLTRPFTMSEAEMENVPPAYSQQGLTGMLEHFSMLHGVGINRWQPFGTFAMESNLKGLPSAGAQSGSTCDVLLALNTLNPDRIYGNEHMVLAAGLGIAAFMNFGGYHTFAETFPIAEAVAANRPYVPTNLAATNQMDLYQRIETAAQTASPQGAKQLGQFRRSHAQVLEGLRHNQPDGQQALGAGVDFYATAQQIADWRK